MNNLWSWIATLPSSPQPPPPLVLASSSGRSILLSADPTTTTAAAAAAALLTFSISLNGFHPSNPTKILWLSDPIPLSATTAPLLLLLQLLHQVTIPHLPKPDPARLLLALGSLPDTPNLLCLALLCHLFWLCAGESSADAGFLFFREFDAALDGALDCGRSLRAFLLAAGADREERFMRSVGYMIAKWSILRELSASTEMRRPFPVGGCRAYAAESKTSKKKQRNRVRKGRISNDYEAGRRHSGPSACCFETEHRWRSWFSSTSLRCHLRRRHHRRWAPPFRSSSSLAPKG